ncbi:hypothetical protein P153DRAFT_346150 [Dothidotthia symphoricarpi CBS 119687]|uniref:Rhodopsin domain-containing protein n=1 Tax=Dothidotthia symphoricarpi CBS 119687 TaxID=1392245 RepID=A0A6A6A344_9PLEO|nr:uncharacterized protein P153DRAFT_346150 [Dothidotthia symphoricarpi CBS 119687]KAF2126432.1 hypothetical protein P153DRAFT_346150 [Dothidotthia symphoricarpi CBS 119687]
MAVSPLEAALIETWTLYAFGTIIFMLRIFVRTRMVGIAGFRVDDYTIFFAWICYTGMTVAAHFVGGTGDTSHLTMEQRLSFTPEQAASRQAGTKWFMVGWYTYIGLIWTLKLNMLFFYKQVVGIVWVKKLIMPAMSFVAVTGVSIWILFATACRPFHKLWQILPDPGEHCIPQSPVFLLTILVLNLLTDVCIILIPIPIIIPLKISWGRKLGLLFLFCAGIFIMIAAILRVYFVLALEKGETAAIWSCREDIVAITIGQATMIRPIFTRRFWTNKPGHSSGYSSNKPSHPYESHELSHQSNSLASRLGLSKTKDTYGVSILRTKGNDSDEDIMMMDGEAGCGIHREPSLSSDQSHRRSRKEITVKTDVEVSTDSSARGFDRSWNVV